MTAKSRKAALQMEEVVKGTVWWWEAYKGR